jgi:hypothetical protein
MKTRSWLARRVEHKSVRLAEDWIEPQIIMHPLGWVEAASRSEAEQLAAAQWPGVDIDISRGDAAARVEAAKTFGGR